MVETRGSVPPPGKVRRSPRAVGSVMVKLNETACASAGMPHWPPMTNVRSALAARAGAPYGPAAPRVSATRHGVTVWYCAWSEVHAENSEVFPAGSVAVAVRRACGETVTGRFTLNVALHEPSVVTSVEPRNVCPSPEPEGSQEALEKNSIRYVVFATEFSVPWMLVLPPEDEAVVRTG